MEAADFVPAQVTPAAEAARADVAPSPLELTRALLGYALLGIAGMLGDGAHGLSASPVALVSGAGMLLLTVPALVVAHQYLKLSASPAAIVGEIGRVFTRCGDLALGAVPALLLFSVTSGLGGFMLGALLTGVGALAFFVVIRRLFAAEMAASGGRDWASMVVLTLGWAGLTSLVGLRLALTFAPSIL